MDVLSMKEHTKGWIAVDLDGTLAHYDCWRGADHIGAPIHAMIARVKRWIAEGRDVRIFTGRVAPGAYQAALLECPPSTSDLLEAREAATAIRKWCEEHIGCVLPVTCVKDLNMLEVWDDRAVQVQRNTGQPTALR